MISITSFSHESTSDIILHQSQHVAPTIFVLRYYFCVTRLIEPTSSLIFPTSNIIFILLFLIRLNNSIVISNLKNSYIIIIY